MFENLVNTNKRQEKQSFKMEMQQEQDNQNLHQYMEASKNMRFGEKMNNVNLWKNQ